MHMTSPRYAPADGPYSAAPMIMGARARVMDTGPNLMKLLITCSTMITAVNMARFAMRFVRPAGLAFGFLLFSPITVYLLLSLRGERMRRILWIRMLRPCPVLDNPGRLTQIVEKSQARSTDVMAPETAKDYSDKCVNAAKNWAPVAADLWHKSGKDKE